MYKFPLLVIGLSVYFDRSTQLWVIENDGAEYKDLTTEEFMRQMLNLGYSSETIMFHLNSSVPF